jgi:hypothetical protein
MGVEVDPANGFRMVGYPRPLIEHHGDLYGWEVPGANNQENRTGWNEGPCVVHYQGKYYLQYAAPGTEYRIYADGIYVGDHPLGPFTYAEYNPFSIKPGGFIGGAGHGHTFRDRYGNYWHVASMKISVRHAFERRLGLFPVYFTDDGRMFCHTVWSDYPFVIPDEKMDFEDNDLSMHWRLLSYRKPTTASSSLAEYVPGNAVNEQIESWWAAESGAAGEWWQVDLEKPAEVRAIQINMADQDFSVLGDPHSYISYSYRIEHSDDGAAWMPLVDRTEPTADAPHELVVLEEPVRTRYLRITCTRPCPGAGKFSLSGFRVFGQALSPGDLLDVVTQITVKRNPADARRFQLVWRKSAGADGYVVRWGVRPDRLNNAAMVYSNTFAAGYFNRDSEYYFSVDAFNEYGIAAGQGVSGGAEGSMAGAAADGLRVFPNPSSGVFHVEMPHAGRLSLFDLQGRRLYACEAAETRVAIHAADYVDGRYILSFVSEKMRSAIQLIKK